MEARYISSYFSDDKPTEAHVATTLRGVGVHGLNIPRSLWITSLLEESLAISSELGMRPLMERVLSRRDIPDWPRGR